MLFPNVVKGLTGLSYNTSTGVTLASRGNSASEKLQGLEVLSVWNSLCRSTSRALDDVVAKISSYVQLPMDAPTRTNFQRFASNPPLSSFKKLILLTLRLLHNLHMMSLVKAVPDGLKGCKCKRITLHKRPPIPYVPKKDSVQETMSALKNNQSLKTQIGEGVELRLSIWHSEMRKASLMHVGSAMDAIKKRGHFKAYEEAHEAYMKQHDLVKQAKTALAELDGTTNECAGTSRKSSKKHKEGAATADVSEPNLQLIFNWTLRRPKKPQRMPRPKRNQLQRTCSSSMQTCCLWTLSTRGTRLSKSRHNLTPTRTYKAYPRKVLGDLLTSHLMTAWWSTFSPCSPITRLSKKGSTWQRCSRSPSASACISLCSVWSNRTPTLCSCHAGSTAHASSPPQFWQMFHSPRLTWWVKFYGCAHLHGRTSSTFTRKIWLLWICICFLCLSRL